MKRKYVKNIVIILTHFRTKSQNFFNVITFMISFHLSEQITDLEERKKTLQSQLYDIFAPLSAIYRWQPFEEILFAIWTNTKKMLQSQLYDIIAPLSAIYRQQPSKLWPPLHVCPDCTMYLSKF